MAPCPEPVMHHPIGAARALLLATVALAAVPAYAIDDRAVLRAGFMQADNRSDLRGRTRFLGRDYTFTQTFGSDGETTPRLDGEVRIGRRHRLVFNHFGYEQNEPAPLSEPISFDDATIPAGTQAFGNTDFRLTGIAYDFALVETPAVSVGLQLGVQYARLEGRLFAQSGASVYDEQGDESGYLPVAGLRAAFAPGDAWRVVLQGQHFDAGWAGIDDVRGRLTRASALVEYRFTERLGVHAGYEHIRIDAHDDDGDGLIGLDQRYRGPTLGISVAF
jgi:hypothetical protein